MTDNPAIEAMGEFIQEKSIAYAIGNDCATVRELGLAGIERLEAAGSVVISVEWLEAVLAYANPIGVMGDHVFAEIRAMIAAAKGEW